MTLEQVKKIIEGLLFAAPHPLTAVEIGKILELDPETVLRLIEQIKDKLQDSGIMIRSVAGGFQFVTRPELAEWIDKIGRPIVNAPLSIAGLETLAIIAYQQPITRSEIEHVRGVRADSAVNTLLERELIIEVGRKDGPGRPILYGTSEQFLVHFGLNSLDELPNKAETLLANEKNA